MAKAARPLAVITGASSGIGRELAKLAAQNGYAVIICANDAGIEDVALGLKELGHGVHTVQADLATTAGVDALLDAVKQLGRPIELLFANAGRGLGRGFADQSFEDIRRVIDTNVTGTVYLLHHVVRQMRARGQGRVLVTGSVAGFIPGTFQAVYNGTKAFIDSFTVALRHELRDSGVTITCLMPGATDTRFFETADMMDTKVGTDEKDSPADVAKTGFDALMRGDESVVHGLKNKAQVAATRLIPASMAAEMHRALAEPGSATKE